MLYLAYNTATRASELVRADIDGVTEHDWGLAVLLRRSKNGPFEEVFIPAEHAPLGVAAIRRWIAVLKEHGITSGPLFPRIDDGEINPARYRRGSPDGRISAQDRRNGSSPRRRRSGTGRPVHGSLRAPRARHERAPSRPRRACHRPPRRVDGRLPLPQGLHG